MAEQEMERRVTAVDDDWRARIERKLDQMVEALIGTIQTPGGALARIDDLERRMKALEGWRMWLLGIGTAVMTSTLTAAAIAAIIKGGKP